MLNIGIRNFQAIDDLDLEVDGFTVLVGRSNIGKSSVHRAVRGLLRNKQGTGFVRRGEDFAEVEISCPDVDATWRKGEGVNEYEVDGEILESVVHGPPPQIEEAGFRQIEAGRDKLFPQVADQFDPLFLLDESGATAAEVLSDVGRLSDVQEAIRRCASDRREIDNTLKVRREDLEETREELEEYDGLESDMKQVEEVRRRLGEIRDLEEAVSEMEGYLDREKDLRSGIDRLDGVDEIEVPDEELDDPLDKLRYLRDRLDDCRTIQSRVDSLDGVDEIEVPEAPENEYEEWKRLRQAKESRDRLASEIKSKRKFVDIDVPESDEVDDAFESWRFLSRQKKERDRIASRIRKLESELRDLEEKREEADGEIDEIFREAGACPTCEREVD